MKRIQLQVIQLLIILIFFESLKHKVIFLSSKVLYVCMLFFRVSFHEFLLSISKCLFFTIKSHYLDNERIECIFILLDFDIK